VTANYSVSKNLRSLTGYNFNTHPPSFITFGTFRHKTFKNRLQV